METWRRRGGFRRAVTGAEGEGGDDAVGLFAFYRKLFFQLSITKDMEGEADVG